MGPVPFNPDEKLNLTGLADEELLERLGTLAYTYQMSALEGLAVDEHTNVEATALEAELSRRGVPRS